MALHHQGQVPLPSFYQQLAAIEDFFHQGEFLLLEEFNKNKEFDNPLDLLASRLKAFHYTWPRPHTCLG
jgi:hypothetical protein